jgi:hypothetical protein
VTIRVRVIIRVRTIVSVGVYVVVKVNDRGRDIGRVRIINRVMVRISLT